MAEARIMGVADDDAGIRLDRWFKRHFPAISHGKLEKLLRTGQIRVDGGRAKAGARLESGQQVRIPPQLSVEFDSDRIKPQRRGASGRAGGSGRSEDQKITAEDRDFIRSLVIYQDDQVIVLNKPSGLAVQGGSKTERHIDALSAALVDGRERPRLVHRLDKDTSGVLLLARTASVAARLAAAFREKEMRKVYWALVLGVPRPGAGTINAALEKVGSNRGERVVAVEPGQDGGRQAVTRYRVVEPIGKRASWLALWPQTGRTHQLRVHTALIGSPIIGDGKYGGAAAFMDGVPGKLHLHARGLAFPRGDGGWQTVIAPLSGHMAESWKFFGFDPDNPVDPFADDPFAADDE